MDYEKRTAEFYKNYSGKLPPVTEQILNTLYYVNSYSREIGLQFLDTTWRKRDAEHFNLEQYISKSTVKKIILQSNSKGGAFPITDPELIEHLLKSAREFSRKNLLGGKQPNAHRALDVIFTAIGINVEGITDLQSSGVSDQFICDFIAWSSPDNPTLSTLSLTNFRKTLRRFRESAYSGNL